MFLIVCRLKLRDKVKFNELVAAILGYHTFDAVFECDVCNMMPGDELFVDQQKKDEFK